MDFSEIFKRIREKTGLKQSEFAERIGIPLPTLKNIETGKTENFSVQILGKVIAKLGLTPNQAFGYEEVEKLPVTALKKDMDNLRQEVELANEKYESAMEIIEKIQDMIEREKTSE